MLSSSMFRSSARSLHALPRLHPFLLQRLKFLLPGLSFCISMLRDVFFGGHPTLHAEDFCTDRLHLDGVKRCGLDTFPGGMVVPVEHYMGMEVRFPYFPCQCPSSLWMAICTGVTPNLSWNLFPSSCSSSMVVSFFDHDHALTERFRLSLHFAPGLFLDESGYLGATFSE